MAIASKKSVIDIIDVSKAYRVGSDQHKVLNRVYLTVFRGEFIAIMGRSGAGKTTFAQIIGGIIKPDSGAVFINKKDITILSDVALSRYRNKQVGYIFQSYSLIPNYNVEDNLALPLIIRGLPKQQRQKVANRMLKLVGLDDYGERDVSLLSGGERQRVAIARALITRPAFLVADEPTGNLDSDNSQAIVKLFRLLARKYGQTIIMVTHDERSAAQADRIVIIKDGKIARS